MPQLKCSQGEKLSSCSQSECPLFQLMPPVFPRHTFAMSLGSPLDHLLIALGTAVKSPHSQSKSSYDVCLLMSVTNWMQYCQCGLTNVKKSVIITSLTYWQSFFPVRHCPTCDSARGSSSPVLGFSISPYWTSGGYTGANMNNELLFVGRTTSHYS